MTIDHAVRPKVAHLEDVAAFAASISIESLICRDFHHAYDLGSASVEETDDRFYESLECENCDTVRTRIIDRNTGIIIGNRYRYPEGYQVVGMGRLSREGRGLLRLHSMDRRYA